VYGDLVLDMPPHDRELAMRNIERLARSSDMLGNAREQSIVKLGVYFACDPPVTPLLFTGHDRLRKYRSLAASLLGIDMAPYMQITDTRRKKRARPASEF
jgi:hypothetical protein